MTRLGRGTGTAPLVASLAAAVALAGAAVFTVARAGCADPGRYVSRDGVVELVGGCVEQGDLREVPRLEYSRVGPRQGETIPNSSNFYDQ
ncbi:hypothetical protein LX15_002652 [Streptoalloteichus tenebrarius]|uniref:Secreted protein n=1 Tax=Streptoalloteichus tenebrarius (strain ATCC 17920 / DSM 40477 / JCM 4838 / CBS 697.72 / NBRC 16177 / NCIMB 11028 / NRRL B-12390 / A12253. 1 / ISP 5477) TaxID=1933 RepID=A0ABT1HTY6_STRSD|nr:hypothetical protein [Streptoalloteichus tenebrarius]MCP2258953.1 hypothetical protein [Streptoalloteichus tenebrarius]BFF01162.1 hypothetical protein GCM10020241_28370 [Streptoalloteichus tenebrarius]